MSEKSTQPVVIIGGLFSSPSVYEEMRRVLSDLTGAPVLVAAVQMYDWLGAAHPLGWARMLDRLDVVVRAAVAQSATGKVTVVGHSAGGLISRLYLGPQPFAGRPCGGAALVSHLITLGSPHYSYRAGPMWRWAEERYPGAYHAPQVRYSSVGGVLVRGALHGSAGERTAYSLYRRLCGEGDCWGDGMVPLASALLDGAQHIVLDRVGHGEGFGGPWYGTPAVVAEWWERCNGHLQPGADLMTGDGAGI